MLVSTTEALPTPIGRRRKREDVLVQFSSVPSGSCRLPSHGLGLLLSITLALEQINLSIHRPHTSEHLALVELAFFDEDPKDPSFLAEQGSSGADVLVVNPNEHRS